MTLAAVTLEPLAVGAGASTLGLLVVLIRVLLKSVSSQGGSWETLSHAQQADAASARAETASVREQKDAVILAMGIEISGLKQQLHDRGPLP